MRTTIDGAGRLVVPKPLREALGIRAGQVLELGVTDGRLEIEVAPTPMRLEHEEGGMKAVPVEPVPVLTSNEVRAALEQTRR